MIKKHEVVIIGAGISGLTAALLASQFCDVAVVSKVHAVRSHSGAAQGRIAAVLGNEEEDPENIGPAASLRATRYIFDTRLGDSEERMDIAGKPHGVWSCKTYWRCTRVCPKGIQVTKNILKTKTRLYART